MFTESGQFFTSGGGYDIDQSIRFNKNNSAYMHRTPSSATNQKTWTWSGWVKGYFDRSSGDIVVFGAGNSGGTYTTELRFQVSTEKLYFFTSGTGGTTSLISSSVYRDPTAWYHIVIAVDTTQSTSTDRIKIYVNGNQLTDFSTETYQGQNTNTALNSTNKHSIGKMTYANHYYPGYQAEMNFIDGLALAPTSFGEYNDDGVWIPKAYDGSYGTNGFYITGATAGDLGEDFSGNGHDFTSSGLAADDQVPDSPTLNFATLNAVSNGGNIALQDGNLLAVGVSNWDSVFATISMGKTGKWYFETRMDVATAANGYISAIHETENQSKVWSNYIGNTTATYGLGYSLYTSGSGYYTNGSATAITGYSSAPAAGDIIMCAVDLDNNKIWWGLNGTWFNSGDPAGGSGESAAIQADTDYTFGVSTSASEDYFVNFGADSTFGGDTAAGGNSDGGGIGDFKYAVPSGFLCLCTANLPTPTIADGSNHFKTLLYTSDNIGAGGSQAVTGMGFQADFSWIKNRVSGSTTHTLYDAVRGAGKMLQSSATTAEDSNSIYGYLGSFDADGYTLTGGSTNANYINQSTNQYVSWNWLAGNGTATNEVGTITSTVSVNTTAGFSIVRAASMAGSGGTIGHGLGTVPDMVIGRMQTETFNWQVWHQGLTNGTYSVHLNDTSAQAAVATVYTALPTSTLINTGASWTGSNPAIFYVFTGVEGFSKYGVYTGNGSADGCFIYTGMTPAFVVIRSISNANSWTMYDTTRQPYNANGRYILAESSAAEVDSTTVEIDILSNGFKARDNQNNINGSGRTYIYMAFAEHPFGGDGVAPATAR